MIFQNLLWDLFGMFGEFLIGSIATWPHSGCTRSWKSFAAGLTMAEAGERKAILTQQLAANKLNQCFRGDDEPLNLRRMPCKVAYRLHKKNTNCCMSRTWPKWKMVWYQECRTQSHEASAAKACSPFNGIMRGLAKRVAAIKASSQKLPMHLRCALFKSIQPLQHLGQ